MVHVQVVVHSVWKGPLEKTIQREGRVIWIVMPDLFFFSAFTNEKTIFMMEWKKVYNMHANHAFRFRNVHFAILWALT